MKKNLLGVFSVLALMFAFSFVAAAPAEKTDGFVCPVFNSGSSVAEHNPNAIPIANGDYSLIPSGTPHIISVATTATNADGAGSPGGEHASTGDTDYTAIWAA